MCSQNARILRLLLLIEQNDFYAEVPQRAWRRLEWGSERRE
jgi:hypothetical protein